MANFTQNQLQEFWNYYVTMTAAEVAPLTDPTSPSYDANFEAMLGYVYRNRLFGFADLSRSYSGKGSAGDFTIFNGPTKS